MELHPLARSLLSSLWYAFVTVGAWIAFYKNYLEPSLKLIERIKNPCIHKYTDKDGNPSSTLQLEIILKEQRNCEFVTWFDKREMHNRSYSNDIGKTYVIHIPFEKDNLSGFKTISIDIKRRWKMYSLSKKTVPIAPLLRINKDYTEQP